MRSTVKDISLDAALGSRRVGRRQKETLHLGGSLRLKKHKTPVVDAVALNLAWARTRDSSSAHRQLVTEAN